VIQRVLLGSVLGVLLIGSGVTACGQEPDPVERLLPPMVSSAPETPDPTGPMPDPTFITIPAIDVRSPELVALGLTDVDCVDEPPCLATPPLDQPEVAGWYAGADPEFGGDEWQPGEPGPAVIAGHVDGIGPDGRKGHPGIFARLGELKPGDEVVVERELAPPLTYVVESVEVHPKNAFPTAAVYGVEREQLSLITCGGAFADGHYVDNVVAIAVPA
jgi:hypothetical protein